MCFWIDGMCFVGQGCATIKVSTVLKLLQYVPTLAIFFTGSNGTVNMQPNKQRRTSIFIASSDIYTQGLI